MTRRELLGFASGAIIAGAIPGTADARRIFGRGGAPVATDIPMQTFQLVEHSSVTSLGLKRFGLLVAPGDCPVGWSLEIIPSAGTIAYQFDNRSSYWDGSGLKFASCCLRDSNFSSGESRSYTVVARYGGTFNNTSSKTVSDVLTGTDIKMEFSSLSGSTTGAQADHASSMNTHSGVSTRTEKYESGPVCVSFYFWGMAQNGGVDHDHLKTYGYASGWLDGSGNVAYVEPTFVASQDWWDVADKEKLTYIATFKNGATTLDTYGGSFNSSGVRSTTVEHVYRTQWAAVRLADDNEHAARHWIGGSRPTLLYKPDIAYWISTKLIPPYDTSNTFVTNPSYTTGPLLAIYQPRMFQPGSSQAHSNAIDAGGAYPGEGVMTYHDVIAFVNPSAVNARICRINAHVGLHLPQHYRSSKTRTRPGDGSADISSTLCPLVIWDSNGSGTNPATYDFTVDGLPAAAHSYYGFGTPSPYDDGYVDHTGGATSGTTVWSGGDVSTHAAPFSLFEYIISGERYFMEATLDLGVQVIHLLVGGNQQSGLPYLQWRTGPTFAVYPGTPTTTYAGIGTSRYRTAGNTRGIGRGIMRISCMAFVPDNSVHANYVKRLDTVNAQWLKAAVDLAPADVAHIGMLAFQTGVNSPWMDALMPIHAYMAYARSLNSDWKVVAEFGANQAISIAEVDRVGNANSFRAVQRPLMATIYDASTNAPFSDAYYDCIDNPQPTINETTNTITGSTHHMLPFTDGDEIVFTNSDGNLALVAVPAEVTAGKVYEIANPVGATSFQVRDPDTSSIVDFSVGGLCGMGIRCQSAANPVGLEGDPAAPADHINYQYCAVVLARIHGHPRATTTVMNRYNPYIASIDFETGAASRPWPVWNMQAT